MNQSFFESKQMRIIYTVTDGHGTEGIVMPKLSHGNRVVVVRLVHDDVVDCDAVITSNKILSLGIRTADCAPICFSDGEKIGIAHVGWRGLCLGLIEKMICTFNQSSLEIVIGPRIDSFLITRDACYERIVTKFGERFFRFNDDEITFMFKDAIASLVPQHAIFDVRSTNGDTTLPSHRRDTTSKRLLTVVQFNT